VCERERSVCVCERERSACVCEGGERRRGLGFGRPPHQPHTHKKEKQDWFLKCLLGVREPYSRGLCRATILCLSNEISAALGSRPV